MFSESDRRKVIENNQQASRKRDAAPPIVPTSHGDIETMVQAKRWPEGPPRVVPRGSVFRVDFGPRGELKDRLRRLQDSIEYWDVAETMKLVSQVRRQCEQLQIGLDRSRWDSIERDLRFIARWESAVLFETEPSPIIVPQLIVPAHEQLLNMLARDPRRLFGLAGREFEELISEIFARQGFAVELTQATRDGGRDIIAIRREVDIPLKFIIECKRCAPERKVSLGIVQRLYGVKMAEGASKAILATTSRLRTQRLGSPKRTYGILI